MTLSIAVVGHYLGFTDGTNKMGELAVVLTPPFHVFHTRFM